MPVTTCGIWICYGVQDAYAYRNLKFDDLPAIYGRKYNKVWDKRYNEGIPFWRTL